MITYSTNCGFNWTRFIFELFLNSTRLSFSQNYITCTQILQWWQMFSLLGHCIWSCIVGLCCIVCLQMGSQFTFAFHVQGSVCVLQAYRTMYMYMSCICHTVLSSSLPIAYCLAKWATFGKMSCIHIFHYVIAAAAV